MLKVIVAIVTTFIAGLAAAAGPLLITGAGATFPFPLYSRWFNEYNRAHQEVRFNYQSVGSGGGIRAITERTVDFAASDAPLTDDQMAKAPGIAHIPTVLGADVITFNLPGVTTLKLTPELVAGIFLGRISKWNDPALAHENPGPWPDQTITVVHRSDGSGTTAIFTDYLAKTSPDWAKRVGHGTSVKWPTGLGGKGNEGVTGLIKQTPGSLGYVELVYAEQNALPTATLRNAAGTWVRPTIVSISAAAAGVDLPADFRVSITAAPGADAYPISAFTYILLYKEQPDVAKGTAVVRFLAWAIHDGQKIAPKLSYAPLPAPVVKKVEAKLHELTAAGKPIALSAGL